jgi:hypothetical protein
MDINVTIVVVVALMVTFGMPIIMVAIVSMYKMRKNRLTHGTILALAEKGMSVPPELLVPPQRPLPTKSDLKTGILLLSAGLGISLFFFEINVSGVSLGAIPILMGLGYIIVWKIEKKSHPSGA